MKKIYIKLIALTLFAFISSTKITKACIDYIQTPPPLTVKIDSTWTKFEMTVHNLQIFAGAPGDFCTCGLVTYAPFFDFIYYVAFVDSGTTNPINGFDVWNPNASATNAWSAQIPFSTWNGFVAAVINNMTPNTPVELIIKADLPAGYTAFWQVDSTLSVSGLGADEWDNTNDTLAFTHNSITSFGATTFELVSPTYFTAIENIENSVTVNIYPNPGSNPTTFFLVVIIYIYETAVVV
jgi:hypothetical protein